MTFISADQIQVCTIERNSHSAVSLYVKLIRSFLSNLADKEINRRI